MKKYIVPKEKEGIRIDKFVTEQLRQESGLENVPRSFVSKHLASYVKVEGRSVKPSYKINCNDTIILDEVSLGKEYRRGQVEGELESNIVAQEGNLQIIFEDTDFLVLKKPAGLVVHPGIGNRDNTLANYVKYYLEEKGEYDIELKRAGIVHRLDKGVSGLIVFAKNRAAQKHLSEQFEKHEILKIYYAQYISMSQNLCKGIKSKKLVDDVVRQYLDGEVLNLDEWQKITGVIKRDSFNRKRMVFYPNSFDEKYRYAESYLLPLSKESMFVLIKTGRMHQIRATLKSLGMVLRGDELYGYKKGDWDRIGLESVVLGFKDLSGARKVFNIIDNIDV